MLHIEAVSLVGIDSASADVIGSFGPSTVLMTKVVIDSSSRVGDLAKQFFIKLPAKNDLVFKVALSSGLQLQAQLSKEYLSSVALSVSQAKTVHLKPVSGGAPSAAGLKIKLDFVVPQFEAPKTESAETLDARYLALLDCVKQASPQAKLPKPRGSELLRPKTTGSSGTRLTRSESVVDDKLRLTWDKHDFFTVVRILVRPGSAVMPGTPLLEIESRNSGGGSDSEVAGYVANGDDTNPHYKEEQGPVQNYYKQEGTPKLKHSESRTGYMTPGLGDSPAGSDAELALAIEEDEKELSIIETLCWTRSEVGVVTELFVRVDTVLNDPSDKILTLDVSPSARRLAFLTLADQASMDLRGPQAENANDTSLNSQFQNLAEELSASFFSGIRNEARMSRVCAELERVSRNFFQVASRYAQVIISEMHLPLESRSVRPLKMGGVLGGHKYIVRGILFKFANGDIFSDYPDPLYVANKVQGHELKGLRAYFGWFFNRGLVGTAGCSFPLAALIDYKGHRITALAVLPVNGSSSLIYGSDDAGSDCNVKMLDENFSATITKASEGLNLAKHFVLNGRAKKGEVEIASCVDLEGHRGSDGRLYMLDFSRTFPPAVRESKLAHDTMWIFYHMLRPELVRRWERPLCADAFSNFQSPAHEAESKAHNQEVRAATTWLETEGVLRVARACLNANDTTLEIAKVFHGLGMNLRYLGLVYATLVSSALFDSSRKTLYTLVLCEACMRVFKMRIRSQLRAVTSEDESDLAAVAASELNLLFGAYPNLTAWQSTNAWVIPALEQHFNFDARGAKAAVENFFSGRPITTVSPTFGEVMRSTKWLVLDRLSYVVGLGLSSQLLEQLQEGKRRSFSHKMIFEDCDISFTVRVKNLDIVERAASTRYYLQAVSEGLTSEEPLMNAFELLETALQGMPSDVGFLSLFGDVNKALYEMTADKDAARSLLFKERAESSYRQAALLDENNPRVQMQYGMFLHQLSRPEAEAKLLRAAELLMQSGADLPTDLMLALVFLLDQRQSRIAAQMRETFAPRTGSISREVSILPSLSVSDADQRPKLLKKVGKMIRKSEDVSNLASIPQPEERLLEGYLMKRKKGNDSMTTKKRWLILTNQELFYFRDNTLSFLCGSLSLAGGRVSLQDPVLTLELGDGVAYTFTSDFDSSNQPSVLRWHDALAALFPKTSPRSSSQPTMKISPVAIHRQPEGASGSKPASSFKSLKKLLHHSK